MSASKRDAIQQLKEEAANGEFDILLVYLFDRLGRIESETPFVLEWFVQHGIEIWSTHEGQQKIETHGDKLMNYIRFWQAAGESEKTSIRTRDRIRQIVSSGHYTGGFVCYGHQLVDQGRRNKRDKPVMDLVVNEEEATWVRELFYKVVHEGASGYALAEMLNSRGLRTRAGAKFQSSNILRIIRHEGYTGYIITKNARSEYIPELQIIDQETFEKANDIISRRSAKTAQDRRIAHTSQNTTLLAGIVYCAHCGAKMSGFMHTDRYKLADGSIREKVQPKYNCFQRGQRNKGGRDCDGQALYLAERVDAIVLKIVEEVFEKIRDTPYSKVAENRIRQESNLQKTKRTAVEKKIKAAQHALERFEGEILKCLDGTSNFTEDMIAKQIRRYQQELDDAKGEYAELQNARLNEAAEIRKLRTYYNDFRGWAEEFDTAPLEMKRMILSQLINKVEVGRKYQVNVKFNMKYQHLWNMMQRQKAAIYKKYLNQKLKVGLIFRRVAYSMVLNINDILQHEGLETLENMFCITVSEQQVNDVKLKKHKIFFKKSRYSKKKKSDTRYSLTAVAIACIIKQQKGLDKNEICGIIYDLHPVAFIPG